MIITIITEKVRPVKRINGSKNVYMHRCRPDKTRENVKMPKENPEGSVFDEKPALRERIYKLWQDGADGNFDAKRPEPIGFLQNERKQVGKRYYLYSLKKEVISLSAADWLFLYRVCSVERVVTAL